MSGDYKVSIELAAKVSDYVRGMDLAGKATDRLRTAQQGASRSSAELAAELTAAGAAARASAGDIEAAARQVQALERAERRLQEQRARDRNGPRPNPPGPDPVPPPDRRRSRRNGEETGESFIQGVTSALASKGGIAAVLGVGLAPTLGAAAAGAIIGGAGAAGVIGGLFLAAKDPRVAQAGSALGQEMFTSLKKDATVFVQPALGGIRTLRTGFRQLEPDLARIFQGSAKFVNPLVQGALKGAKSITAGVAAAVEAAGPVVDAFSQSFEKIGGAVGDVFTKLGPDAKSAALGINDITNAVVGLIDAGGEVVHILALIRGGSDGNGGLEAVDRGFDKARYWVEDSSQLSDVFKRFGVNLDLTADGFKKNSAEGQAYRRMTLGVASAQDLQLLASKGVQEAIDQVGGAQKDLGQTTGAVSDRQKILNATMAEAVDIAGDLGAALDKLNGPAINFAQAEITAERAVDALEAGLKKNGKALNKQGTDFDITTKKGQENKTLLLALAAAANDAAAKRQEEGGTVAQVAAVHQKYVNTMRAELAAHGLGKSAIDAMVAKYAGMTVELTQAAAKTNVLNGHLKSIPKGTKFIFDGHSLVNGKGQSVQLAGSLKNIPVGKTFHWNGSSLVDGRGHAVKLKKAVDDIPKHPKITAKVDTSQANSGINAVESRLNALHDKTVHVYVATSTSSTNAAEYGAAHQARGGVMTAMAAGGITQAGIYRASNPPLVRFAEPETGGEGYVPKNGNRARNLAIMSEMARWPSVNAMIVPMARGGIAAASGALVNVAAGTSSGGNVRLESVQAYLAARDAVTSLNAALKENGRSFSSSTQKGRDNQAAVYAAIKAAQDAAAAKYAETKSVTAANAAYNTHIGRLRADLSQHRVNASTLRGMLAVAGRPAYDTPVRDSSSTIGFVKAKLGLNEAVGNARNFFTWGKPSFNSNTTTGADELNQLFTFLEQASSAAQARYAQTGSAKSATAQYNQSLSVLRVILGKAGMKKADIDKLFRMYGRITLASNASGGVYGGLSQAMALPAGDTLYQWREPSTGGEAFVPKNGSRARSEQVLQTAAGWYGGRYVRGGASGAGSAGGMTVRVVVHDGAVRGLVRVEVDEQFGALADAHVYATAN